MSSIVFLQLCCKNTIDDTQSVARIQEMNTIDDTLQFCLLAKKNGNFDKFSATKLHDTKGILLCQNKKKRK